MTTTRETPDTLDARMEFDSVYYSDGAGNITDDTWKTATRYAPEDVCVDDTPGEPYTTGYPTAVQWQLVSGYSGQHGYRGPVMHPSEYIGGRIAEHILETPGYYAVVEVRDENGEYPDEPVGWALAYSAPAPEDPQHH